MNQAEIEGFFRSLDLETEEKRAALRFEPLLTEERTQVQVITTDSTQQMIDPEIHENA
jgi:hypothetical protein